MGWGGTLTSGGGGGGGPGPVVQNFQPPAQTPILRNTALTFDVVFTSPVVALVVTIIYRDTGATEVAYNSNGFTINYVPHVNPVTSIIDFEGSTVDTVGSTMHFVLRRRGGWPLSPSVLVEGADDTGGRITGAEA